MDADDLSVGRQVEVSLDGIGSLFPCEFEGGESVFRGVVGSTAMGDQEGLTSVQV